MLASLTRLATAGRLSSVVTVAAQRLASFHTSPTSAADPPPNPLDSMKKGEFFFGEGLSTDELPTGEPAALKSEAPKSISSTVRQLTGSFMKVNIPAQIIRGLRVDAAINQMRFAEQRPAGDILNALINLRDEAKSKGMDVSDLYVSQSYATKGSMFRQRIIYKARGRGYRILRHQAHYHLELCQGPVPLTIKEQRKKDPLNHWRRKSTLDHVANPMTVRNC